MSTMHRILLGVALLALAPAVAAQQTDPFKDADPAIGRRLIAEHQCAQCHARNVGGDGSAIYRPQGRINSPARLVAMVEYCNTQMNLGMFPEDVNAVAAALQQDHYHFK